MFELKVNHLSELLGKEVDKSKLLESQLAENHKKIRMLTTGTSTLDHLLTLDSTQARTGDLDFKDRHPNGVNVQIRPRNHLKEMK